MKRLLTMMLALILCAFVCFAEDVGAAEDSGWILTQYSAAGFYSIVNLSDGTLILIDSGNPENADQVRQVIEVNGGKVDYWFMTHYHADHCGAFNAVYPEYKDKIGTIYITPLTWEEYEPNINPWDAPETFQLFFEQTKGAENIVALHRGDEFDIGDLHFIIFNAWDDEVTCSEIANNCSLMFKVQSANSSFLFFGDVSFLSSYILEKYGAKALHADYVQAGHHGWQVPMGVYEAIEPGEMFIDAMDELINSPEYVDRHGVLVRWCQEHEIPYHTLNGTPYSIELE